MESLQVLERQKIDHFFEERDLSAEDICNPESRPVFSQLGVQYLVLGNIVEKDSSATGEVSSSAMTARRASLSLRLADVTSGEVIAATLVQGSDLEELVQTGIDNLNQRLNVIFRDQDL